MRKRIIGSTVIPGKAAGSNGLWLPLEQIATVEVTSEDPRFPVESVFASDAGTGWRASQDGEQQLRIIFDEPTTLHRIQLDFFEPEVERTQEFTIRWSSAEGGATREGGSAAMDLQPDGLYKRNGILRRKFGTSRGPGIVPQAVL
jgi:uncharacterized protein (DUF736 family)